MVQGITPGKEMLPASMRSREQLFRERGKGPCKIETWSVWCHEPRLRAVGAMKLSPRLPHQGL